MVDMGGIMQKRVDEDAQDTVESTFRATYLFPLIKAIREADAQYLAYRGCYQDSDISRSMQIMGFRLKTGTTDNLTPLQSLSFASV